MADPSSDSVAAQAAESLASLPDDLAAAYPRLAHRGRLEQVDQHCRNLASLVAELDAEEEREADFAARLLVMHDAGVPVQSAHGQERLAHALASREAGA